MIDLNENAKINKHLSHLAHVTDEGVLVVEQKVDGPAPGLWHLLWAGAPETMVLAFLMFDILFAIPFLLAVIQTGIRP